ncbi:hypothetical protein TWF694_006692 [Orbilia ellipsospora]|uniref:Heme haloperoxidase family profile domain-containing protein n=1 Tax=Orbilia ellipsospora TaxID=2528407 RepID=A0AAV9XMJ1_9PEZI
MATEQPLKKGEYQKPPQGALRSPCPVLNTLSNHGYIPRDGRNIHAADLKAGLTYLGLDLFLRNYLVDSAFKVHEDDPAKVTKDSDLLGLRNPGQVDERGIPVLNLDQVGRPNAVEHACSMTRRDREQGDCISMDPELMAQLIGAAGSDGYYSMSDMAEYRKVRYAQQKRDNAELKFNVQQHTLACGEIGAFQATFGRGPFYKIPLSYIKAMFVEERLPLKEGWTPRWTWLGFPELVSVMFWIRHYAWPSKEFGVENVDTNEAK